jgi:hypothetical protein
VPVFIVAFHPAAEPVNADPYWVKASLIRVSGDWSNALVSSFVHDEKTNTAKKRNTEISLQ